MEAFLPQNLQEPDNRYEKRKEQAPYHNYVGPIIDKFAAMLLASPPTPQVVAEGGAQDAPEQEWLDWRQDVDGNGGDMTQFFREQFTDALMKKRAIWALYKPNDDGSVQPRNRAEWKQFELGKVCLKELETQDCLDWETDAAGRLKWLLHHTVETPRETVDATRDMVVETWTVYDRENVRTFQLKYKKTIPPKPDADVPLVKTWAHELGECPIVILEMPDGLWVADRVHDVQLEHFRVGAALSWALKQSCYAMALFFLKDGGRPPQMGTGIGIILDAEDKVDWLSPDTSHFAVMQAEKAALKDEIYRIVHQMSDASSNNSGTIGRSGVSKSADLFSTRTILEAFSELLRSAIERTMVMVGRLRGEDIKWTISGLDQFDDMNLAEFITSLEGIESLGIPSETYDIEVRRMLVNAILPNIDEATRAKIYDQIEEGVAKIREMKEQQAQADLELSQNLAKPPDETDDAHNPGNIPPKGQKTNPGGGKKGSGVAPPSRTNAGGRAGFGRGAAAASR